MLRERRFALWWRMKANVGTLLRQSPILPVRRSLVSVATSRQALSEHGVGLLFSKNLKAIANFFVTESDDAGGKQRGVFRSGRSDGKCPDWNASGHLRDGQK